MDLAGINLIEQFFPEGDQQDLRDDKTSKSYHNEKCGDIYVYPRIHIRMAFRRE